MEREVMDMNRVTRFTYKSNSFEIWKRRAVPQPEHTTTPSAISDF